MSQNFANGLSKLDENSFSIVDTFFQYTRTPIIRHNVGKVDRIIRITDKNYTTVIKLKVKYVNISTQKHIHETVTIAHR